MEDIFILELPINYEVKFEENENYKYNSKGENNLKKILSKASRGYCMYCYTRIELDGRNYGHLEHTIEQNIAPSLINCHHNISLVCPTCNLSLKKREQNKRIIKIDENLSCNFSCKDTPCDTYYTITNNYIENLIIKDDVKKFILMPRGIIQKSQTKEKIYYKIAYDLQNFRFIPYNDKRYLLESKKYIEEHIEKFCLNDEKYRTKEIEKVIEDILTLEKIPNKTRYNNLVAELFIEKLEKIYSQFGIEKIKKISLLLEIQRIMKNG